VIDTIGLNVINEDPIEDVNTKDNKSKEERQLR